MKSREKEKTAVLRLIQAAIRKAEIDGQKDLDDAGVVTVLGQMAKQRKDSITQFKSGNRDDLVAVEEAELATINAYLPEPMSETELEAIVLAAIAEVGASSPKDMGAVMKVVMAKSAGRADGKMLSQLVRSKLV